MSQDDQNRDPKNQGEGPRESRTESSAAPRRDVRPLDRAMNMDEMDEDRDEDDRSPYVGGPNRRRSIN